MYRQDPIFLLLTKDFIYFYSIIANMATFYHSEKAYPERDLSLGPSRNAVFEDCKATNLTSQPPQLDQVILVCFWETE